MLCRRGLRKFRIFLCATVANFQIVNNVYAQSNPGLFFGEVPTAAQWNGYFSNKQDYVVQTVTSTACGADPTGTNDSTTAIQTCINNIPATGGDVFFPCGTYLISAISIGNGTNGAASTNNGIRLFGQGIGSIAQYGYSQTPCVTLKYNSVSGGGNMLSVNGVIQGWSVQNIAFNGSASSNAQAGNCMQVISGQFGEVRNISLQNCKVSIGLNAWSSIPAGATNADTIHNTFINTNINVPNTAGAIGISMTGGGTVANVDYNSFINTYTALPVSGVNNTTAWYFGFADSNNMYNTHVAGGTLSSNVLVFDYTVVTGFPTANQFYGIDPAGSSAPPTLYANIGSPSGIYDNHIWGLELANGATIPAIAGLCAEGPTFSQKCGTTSGQVTQQVQPAAGTYNWNWPTTAGAANQVLTSAGGGASAMTWTDIGSWGSISGTLTPACTGATFTTNSARSKTIGKTTFIDFDITASGTCTGNITFAIPNVSISNAILSGKEVAVSGVTITCVISSNASTGACSKYDGTVAGFATADRFVASGSYENQ